MCVITLMRKTSKVQLEEKRSSTEDSSKKYTTKRQEKMNIKDEKAWTRNAEIDV